MKLIPVRSAIALLGLLGLLVLASATPAQSAVDPAFRLGGDDGRGLIIRWLPDGGEKALVKVRVHTLDRPLRACRFRLTVDGVVPLDGRARLLQVEAWGPER